MHTRIMIGGHVEACEHCGQWRPALSQMLGTAKAGNPFCFPEYIDGEMKRLSVRYHR
ncbi:MULTISPECIES: hypothetical protein [unclassified Mesorhizobium]|uniref:hypothetical protein n=1 Tax=unclassified Mesorhizobium TaxID=325217 RepID=UPI0015E2D3C3|nr:MULTISPECIES: hypothetical protein [unclassified Mesorhizobium]